MPIEALQRAADLIAVAIQIAAIVIVVVGSVRAVAAIARIVAGPRPGLGEARAVWLDYARWLVAALTFQLAADIVATSFSPTWDELGRLAVVAVVRTFLAYFLDREIDERLPVSQHEPSPGRGGLSRHAD